MLTHIEANSVSQVVHEAIKTLDQKGVIDKNRNGEALYINNAFLTVNDPSLRHLTLEGRGSNIFAMIAETFWIYAGDDKIDPYLSFFLPRAKDYSDDGVTWRGSYGPRIYAYDQLDDLFEQFRNEGKKTRRATLYIGTPELDTKCSLKYLYNLNSTKDKPCNMVLDVFVCHDNKLHMNVKSRSGDIIWGLGSINLFEWTYLQEYIVQEVRKITNDPTIQLGSYNHHCSNMHVYDWSYKQKDNILESKQYFIERKDIDNRLIFPENGVEAFKDFHTRLVNIFIEMIEDEIMDEKKIESYLFDILDLFHIFHVEPKENMLFSYAILVYKYILTKKDPSIKESFSGFVLPEDLKVCVEKSKFRKFNI